MLCLDPEKRIGSLEALNHVYIYYIRNISTILKIKYDFFFIIIYAKKILYNYYNYNLIF